LIVDYVAAIHERDKLKKEGKLQQLPEASQIAADRSYLEAADRLAQGLDKVMSSYERSGVAEKTQMAGIWSSTGKK
jgi:hypothetical protein